MLVTSRLPLYSAAAVVLAVMLLRRARSLARAHRRLLGPKHAQSQKHKRFSTQKKSEEMQRRQQLLLLSPPLRVVHWNVFEDGLNQAPLALGFSGSFTRRLDALLAAVVDDGSGNLFMGFDRARDFSVTPGAVPIDSTARLFGFVDVVYSAFYHNMGGEIHFEQGLSAGRRGRRQDDDDDDDDAVVPPHLRMSLRTLFLRTARGDDGKWRAPDFDFEVRKALNVHAIEEARTRAIKESVFDEAGGVLQWSLKDHIRPLWKRGDHVLRKWKHKIPIFAPELAGGAPKDNLSPSQQAALLAMSRLRTTPRPWGKPLDTLLEFTVDEASGEVTHISTATSHSAVRVVLQRIFRHAARNGGAARLAAAVEQFHCTGGLDSSVVEFVPEHIVRLWRGLASQAVQQQQQQQQTGDKTLRDEILKQLAEACADMVAPVVWREMDAWIEQSSLNHRHGKVVSRIFGNVSHSSSSNSGGGGNSDSSSSNNATASTSEPALITFVEYDQEWRNLGGLPDPFIVVSGRGNASVAFDSRLLSPFHGYELPSKFVRGTVKPKSSCIVLLRQLPMSCKAPCESRPISGVRCSPDTELPLVLACVVHLSSAPASDTRKVKLRRAEMRATLAEISTVVGEIQDLGQRCVVVLSGDFNAIREEFVFGNGDEFYASEGLRKIVPVQKRPVDGSAFGGSQLGGSIARITPSGQLALACSGVDGGELLEASYINEDVHSLQCTRAGTSKVIDFVMVGSVGLAREPDVQGACNTLAAATLRSERAVANKTATRRFPTRVVGIANVLVPADVAERAADPASGIFKTVSEWGSDHLPVGCEIATTGEEDRAPIKDDADVARL